MTIEIQETQGSSGAPKRTTRWRWLIAAAVGVVAAALIAGLVASRGDDSTAVDAAAGAQQLESIQEACTQWHDGDDGSSAPSAAWCDDMVGWMSGQVRSGQMMGSMMWGNPDQMLATCQRWMSSTQASGSASDPSASCGRMVGWMTEHMGDWEQWDQGWMMNGSMMGS